MQGHSCSITYILFHGDHRSEARMSSVTILIPASYRLDHNRLQKIEEMGSSGHLGPSWRT